MDEEALIRLVKESLEAIEKKYRMINGRSYERIICYEFYYQFRERMKQRFPLTVLHGELPKVYRGIKKTPDFVFHIPGKDTENYLIIEFKNIKAGIKRIKNDFDKLDNLRNKLSYETCILVVFGKQEELTKIKSDLKPPINVKIFLYDLENGKVHSLNEE